MMRVRQNSKLQNERLLTKCDRALLKTLNAPHSKSSYLSASSWFIHNLICSCLEASVRLSAIASASKL